MSNFLSRATALFAALAVFGMGSAGAVITATIAKATKINRLYVSESSSTDNKISIPAGAVIVDGDAAFHAPAGYFLEVEVGASGPVAFIPTYPGMSGATYDVGHLAFWAGLGGEILVDVQDDLFLSGYNNSSTNVTVSQDLTIYGRLWFSHANSVVDVNDDIIWGSGSTDTINIGEIRVKDNWTFEDGSNCTLGTGNTVNFVGTGSQQIYNYDADASFGSVTMFAKSWRGFRVSSGTGGRVQP